jgi:hypothetical protein
MELSAEQRRRLDELAREAREIIGGCCHPDGRPLTFAELEDECIAVSDFFSSTLLQRRVSERPRPETPPGCPTCDRPGIPNHEDEPRVLQTDRGEVEWMEPAYHCHYCRRSFFPSLGRAGT